MPARPPACTRAVPVRKSSTTTTIAAAVSCAIWVRPPALSTISVLVGLPLTTNVPEKLAATLAVAETDEVDVLVEAVGVLHRVGARRGRALGEDDDTSEIDRRQQGHDRVLVHHVGREAPRRQAARHGPEDRDALRLQVEGIARDDGDDDGDAGRPGSPC